MNIFSQMERDILVSLLKDQKPDGIKEEDTKVEIP